MSIQSSINQGISLASLLFTQNPKIRRMGEENAARDAAKRDADRYAKMATHGRNIESRVEELAPEGASTEYKEEIAEGVAAAQQMMADTGETAYRKLYELDPTEENYERYEGHVIDARSIAREKDRYVSSLHSSPTETARDMASRAADAGRAEAERLAASRMLDLSRLDERTIGRVERAYRRAERDTKHLTKRGGTE